MDPHIVDSYTGATAYGSCFLTRATRRDIVEETANGPLVRPEKIVATGIDLDFLGQVCISEFAIRDLAHRFGMVDQWRVQTIIDDSTGLRAQLVALSADLAAARNEIDRYSQLERPEHIKVYMALDGTEHASSRAAQEQTADLLGCEPAMIQDAISTGNPLPTLEASAQ